jgi:hypothetical protein
MKAHMAITGAGLGVLLALTGCASVVNDAAPAITPKPVVTVEQVAEPIEGDTDGDGALSAWESEQLAKSYYTLPDGTKVKIPKDEPLPQGVLDAVEANIAPSAAALAGGTEYTVADLQTAYLDALKAEGAKTGRTIIGIFYGWDYGTRAWVSSKPYINQYGSKEEAIASVEAYIGDKTDRLAYVVFD